MKFIKRSSSRSWSLSMILKIPAIIGRRRCASIIYRIWERRKQMESLFVILPCRRTSSDVSGTCINDLLRAGYDEFKEKSTNLNYEKFDAKKTLILTSSLLQIWSFLEIRSSPEWRKRTKLHGWRSTKGFFLWESQAYTSTTVIDRHPRPFISCAVSKLPQQSQKYLVRSLSRILSDFYIT